MPRRNRFSLPKNLTPLGNWNFALYFCGFATSTAGRWIELTGFVWLTYELTQSPVLLGVLGIARALPAIVLSPLSGVVADRIEKQRILLVTQTVSIAVSLCLALLVVSGGIAVWQVYIGVAIQSSVMAFDTTARQSLFPQLIAREQLQAAVTLSITAARLAKFAGPVIGGYSIAILGESAPFFINAALFLALMAVLGAMRDLPPTAWTAGASFGRELIEGIRYILDSPVFAGLFRMEIVFALFEMNPVIIAIVAREVLDMGPAGLGLLLSAPALGSLAGILWLIAVGQPVRLGRFSLCSTLAFSAALVVFALSRSFVASLASLALIGVLDALVTITRNSILQLAAPDAMRGRIMANMGLVTRGLSPLAETQSGILSATLGAPLALGCAASVLALAAGSTAFLNPTLWNYVLADPSRKGGGSEE